MDNIRTSAEALNLSEEENKTIQRISDEFYRLRLRFVDDVRTLLKTSNGVASVTVENGQDWTDMILGFELSPAL